MAGLVGELYEALRKQIEVGGTARMFRPVFDDLTSKHGWAYQGKHTQRSDLIYQMATFAFARHARYGRITKPEALELYPYWKLHILPAVKSPSNYELWDQFQDRIVPADCEWIRAYLSISGDYFAQANIVSHRALQCSRETVSDEPSIRYYSATDPVTGVAVDTPVGINPGFHKDVRLPVADYVRHFLQLGMVLPV